MLDEGGKFYASHRISANRINTILNEMDINMNNRHPDQELHHVIDKYKNLTPSQLNKINMIITRLQHQYYKSHALKRFKHLSGIDILKQSRRNLLDLYQRLRTMSLLPAFIVTEIQAEKRNKTDLLTLREQELFDTIYHLPIIGNHATAHADRIIKDDGYIYSTHQLQHKKISVQTHTTSVYGETHFAFLSYGLSESVDCVNFLAGSPVLLINLDDFQKKYPILYSGAWCSGHFFGYDHRQFSRPIEIKSRNSATRISLRYNVTFEPLTTYTRQFSFTQSKISLKQTLAREAEICAGHHIKLYHALRFIEILRYIDLETRHFILRYRSHQETVAQLFNAFFTPGKMELHIPEIVPIKQTLTIIKRPFQPRLLSDKHKIRACLNKDDLVPLAEFLKDDTTLKLLEFDSYEIMLPTYGHYTGLSLLHIAVLKQNINMVRLLIKYQYNLDQTYLNKDQHLHNNFAERTALQDAIQFGNMELIKLLCTGPSHTQKIEIYYCATIRLLEMMTAIAYNSPSFLFLYLLNQYRKYETNFDNLLCVAVVYERLEIIAILLKAGANPNVTCDNLQLNADTLHLIPSDKLYGTALTIAIRFGLLKATQMLLDNGADINAVIKHADREHDEGKGNSPLIEALLTIININKPLYIDSSSISDCRYLFLVHVSRNNAHAILSLLLRHEKINRTYVAGDGKHFTNLLSEYLLQTNIFKEPLSYPFLDIIHRTFATKPFISEKVLTQIQHSYALIFGIDEHQNNYLLLGECDDNKSPYNWHVPGGEANFVREKNLSITAINHTAYQVGLDLSKTMITKSDKFVCINPRTTTKHTINVYHFVLANLISDHPIYSHTRYAPLYLQNNHYDSTLAFKHIRFVPFDEIAVHIIFYRDVPIPICLYQNMVIRYTVGLSLAEVLHQKEYQTQEVYEMIAKLEYDAWSLVVEAIESNKLDDILTLTKLNVSYLIQKSNDVLELALHHNHFEIVDYLLALDFHLDAKQFVKYLQDKIASNVILDEHILRALYLAHKSILTPALIDLIVEYSVTQSYISLLNKIIDNNDLTCLNILEKSFIKMNIYVFQCLIEKSDKALLPNYAEAILLKAKLAPITLSEYEVVPYLLTTLFEQCNNHQLLLNNWHISRTCEQMLEVIKYFPSHIQLHKKYLAVLIALINYKCFNALNIDDVYLHYKNLLSKASSEIAHRYLVAIIDIPMVKIIHASYQNNEYELVTLLDKYHDDLIVKSFFLRQYLCLDIQLIMLLSIKYNLYNNVKMLLECGYFKRKEFAISAEETNNDAKKQSLITAIQFKRFAIAKLLIVHGAKITSEYAEFSKQHDASEIYEYIASRLISSKRLPKYIAHKKTDANIMCFGMIRDGKGFNHILKLAELIKMSGEPLLNCKTIYVVGLIEKNNKHFANMEYNLTLYNLLVSIYPQHQSSFHNKTAAELCELHEYLSKGPYERHLPIRLFLNVEDHQLAELFAQCVYGFYPADKGMTFHSNSLATMLASQLVVYTHCSEMTPDCMKEKGEYHAAVVLIKDKNNESYANEVARDIIKREHDLCNINRVQQFKTKYNYLDNDLTLMLAADLVQHKLSLQKIRRRDLEVHTKFVNHLPTETYSKKVVSVYHSQGLFNAPRKYTKKITKEIHVMPTKRFVF